MTPAAPPPMTTMVRSIARGYPRAADLDALLRIASGAVKVALRCLGGVRLTVPPESLTTTGTLWSSAPLELPVRFEASGART